jgi:peroxiredoxin
MRILQSIKYFTLFAMISILTTSCATSIKTSVKNDAELARIGSFGVIEVAELRQSADISRHLAPSLQEKGYTVEKASVADEDALKNIGLKLGVDGIIYGQITRFERDSWVTDGEERVRTRETSYGIEERITYEPPKVITNQTIHVRLTALEGLNANVIWDAEGRVTGDGAADTDYLIKSLIDKLVGELAPPSAEALVPPEPPMPQPVEVGGKAPDFTTETVDGDRVTLSDYQGKKIVVLNFWGVRCLPCLQEMPKLQDIYMRYKDRGVEMLGVNVDGVDAQIIRKNLRKEIGGVELNVTYPLLIDLEFSIIDAYYLTVAPLTAIIDHDGVIRYLHIDYQPGDEIELENEIKKLL